MCVFDRQSQNTDRNTIQQIAFFIFDRELLID